jgi:hypothetical protein
MKVIHRTSGAKTFGVGKATVTTSATTPMPIRFAVTTNVVRMTWMRIRRRNWLSETRPRIQEPYSGVPETRPLWRVTLSRTRPSRCAAFFFSVIVASA